MDKIIWWNIRVNYTLFSKLKIGFIVSLLNFKILCVHSVNNTFIKVKEKKISQSYCSEIVTINLIGLYYSDLIHNFIKSKLYCSWCSDMVLGSSLC